MCVLALTEPCTSLETVGSLSGPLLLLLADRLASTDDVNLLSPVLDRLRDAPPQSSPVRSEPRDDLEESSDRLRELRDDREDS